jgi:hypothetical protein
LLLAFNLGRALDVFSGHLSKLSFRFRVHDPACVPRQFVGLISQIDGAFGHTAVLHIDPRWRCSILLSLVLFRLVQEYRNFSIKLPEFNVVAVHELAGLLFGVFVVFAEKLYRPENVAVPSHDVRAIVLHVVPVFTWAGSVRASSANR